MDMTPPERIPYWRRNDQRSVTWAEAHRRTVLFLAGFLIVGLQMLAAEVVPSWLLSRLGMGAASFAAITAWVVLISGAGTLIVLYPVSAWAVSGLDTLIRLDLLRRLQRRKAAQDAFELWAREKSYSLHLHPVIGAFSNTHTIAAQEAWDAALRYGRTGRLP